jgi:hypothetical protein
MEKASQLPIDGWVGHRAGLGFLGKELFVVVVLVLGAYQHSSHDGLLYSNPPMEFRHSSPEALHTKRRERPLLAKDGTNAKEFS